jgi:hypothetical protein
VEIALNELTITTNESLIALLTGTAPLTSAEVLPAVRLYHVCDVMRRQVLLSIFERKAHDATRKTWEEFCAEYFDMADSTYSYNLLRWARVERSVLGVQNLPIGKLNKSFAMELAKLPAAQQVQAYEEIKALEHSGTHLPKQVMRAAKNIVTRMLNITEKKKETELSHGTTDDLIEETPAPKPAKSSAPYAANKKTRAADVLIDDAPIEELESELPPQTVTSIQPILLKFCDLNFEMRFCRIDCTLPNGNPAYILVPKGAIK